MRIKRQRRKLRGKYSGNCLSCTAKWSKCWYIASIENQAEWESRLNKPVTPSADEVCFQCWDAKIRTSPKRKMHFKAELPSVAEIVTEDSLISGYPLRPSKRVDRNKRRALNEDYAYTLHDSDLSDSKGSDDGSEEEYFIDADAAGVSFKDSVILDEETAVLLLSTAFHSIPQDIGVNVNINITGSVHIGRAMSDEDGGVVNSTRGSYYNGRRGEHKNGHACNMSPSDADQTPSPSSPVSPALVIIPQHTVSSSMPVYQPQSVGIISALLAQPVVS